MKNLHVFVHVSTAFSNCDQTFITEEIFKSKILPGNMFKS